MTVKLNLQLNEIEAGPLRDAFETIRQYLDDKDTSSLYSQDVKTKIYEGELGSLERKEFEMPGKVFGVIGYTEIQETGTYPFKRWRQMDYLGSGDRCAFLTTLSGNNVLIWGNHTTDKLKYRLIVWYR